MWMPDQATRLSLDRSPEESRPNMVTMRVIHRETVSTALSDTGLIELIFDIKEAIVCMASGVLKESHNAS